MREHERASAGAKRKGSQASAATSPASTATSAAPCRAAARPCDAWTSCAPKPPDAPARPGPLQVLHRDEIVARSSSSGGRRRNEHEVNSHPAYPRQTFHRITASGEEPVSAMRAPAVVYVPLPENPTRPPREASGRFGETNPLALHFWPRTRRCAVLVVDSPGHRSPGPKECSMIAAINHPPMAADSAATRRSIARRDPRVRYGPAADPTGHR